MVFGNIADIVEINQAIERRTWREGTRDRLHNMETKVLEEGIVVRDARQMTGPKARAAAQRD